MTSGHPLLTCWTLVGVIVAIGTANVRAEADPASPRRTENPLLKRAGELFATRQFTEVVNLCTRVLQDDDSLAEAYHLRGKARLLASREATAAALDDFESVVRCIELGAEDYLPKPFDPVLLRARINAGLNKRLLYELERVRVRDVFARFLPALEQQEPACLFQPAIVTDRSDGRFAHLDGLNLSRAWCWRNLASALAPSDPRVEIMRDAAARHLEASLQYVSGEYMGEHWLATFALLALEAAG